MCPANSTSVEAWLRGLAWFRWPCAGGKRTNDALRRQRRLANLLAFQRPWLLSKPVPASPATHGGGLHGLRPAFAVFRKSGRQPEAAHGWRAAQEGRAE